MARAKRILVVYKKDAFQQYIQEQQDSNLIRLLQHEHPDALDMQRAHLVHEESMDAIVHTLRQLPVEFDLAYRTGLKVTRPYHLVVSVGGDGTFLEAARSIGFSKNGLRRQARTIPLLGVNADPSRSEAVFCAATRHTFATLVCRALQGRLPEMRLYRLRFALNGKRLDHRALNDVLIVHDDPATMSRYRLQIGDREETQKSSGLWISTAAGSSSAIRAAGGDRLPWPAKRFQYRPRELYRGRLSHNQLRGGMLSARTPLRVTWLMRRGSACIDGPHLKIPLQFADRLEIRLSLTDPIRVLGLTRRRRS